MTTIIQEILQSERRPKEKVALLTEIAKHNPKLQKDLVSKFNIIVETEQNNGVKNVYLESLFY